MRTTKKLINHFTSVKRHGNSIPFNYTYSAMINNVLFETDFDSKMFATINDGHTDYLKTVDNKKEFVDSVYEYLNQENN